jgi:hypothetical protein
MREKRGRGVVVMTETSHAQESTCQKNGSPHAVSWLSDVFNAEIRFKSLRVVRFSNYESNDSNHSNDSNTANLQL